MARGGIVGKLVIALDARTAKFDKGLKRARKSSTAFARHVKLGAIAAAAGLAYLVRQQMKVIDATAKLAARIGESTENIVGLQHAANITGAGAEKLAAGLNVLDKRLGEATMGIGEGKQALEKLGLSAAKLLKMKPAERFRTIAEATSKLATQAEKSAVASKLFSRANQDLVNTLDLGRAGLDKMQKEAKDLGMTFSRLDAKKVEDANDAITRMKGASAGLGRQIAIGLGPGIEAFVKLVVQLRVGLKWWQELTKESRRAAAITRHWAIIEEINARHIAELKQELDEQENAGRAARFKTEMRRLDALNEAWHKELVLKEEGNRLTRQYMTLDETLYERGKKLFELYDAGAISVETLTRAVDDGMRRQAEALEVSSKAYSEAEERHNLMMARLPQARISALQGWAGALQSLSAISAGESRKQFELNKKLQIGYVIGSTAAGIMQAYADPYAFWWEKLARSAAVATAGAAQLASIRSSTFGGGSAPAPAAAGAEGGGMTHMVNVHIEGERVGADQVRALMAAIGEEMGDGVKFTTSRG